MRFSLWSNILWTVIFLFISRPRQRIVAYNFGNNYNTLNNALHIAGVRGPGLRGSNDRACKEGMVTDIALNKCVELICPPNYKKEDFQCIPEDAQDSSIFHQAANFSVCKQHLKVYANNRPSERDFLAVVNSRKAKFGANWSAPCAAWKHIYPHDLKFSQSCDLTTKKEQFALQDLYLYKQKDLRACSRYYYRTNCFLRRVNKTDVKEVRSNEIVVTTSEGKKLLYSDADYLPLKEAYYVCIFQEQRWISNLREVQLMVSFTGACISPFFYVTVLATFLVSRIDFPGFGLVSMCVCLMLSDTFYLFSTIAHTARGALPSHFCKTLAILSHLLALLEQLSVIVLATDNVRTFRRVEILINEPAKEYYKRRGPLVLIPFLFTLIALFLDVTDHLDGGYGKGGICRLVGSLARAVFYTIPVLVTFTIATSLMFFTLFKLRQHTRSTGGSSVGRNIGQHNILLIGLKLVVAYGLLDMFGFLHIPLQNVLGKHANVVFAFLYTVVRSVRGSLFFTIYMCRRSVVVFYKGFWAKIVVKMRYGH